MGILDEEDDSSKPSSSPSAIIIPEAKDSRAEENYRHVNSSAAVPLSSSPHLPQKIPPEAILHQQRYQYPARQYSFNASNFVWSTGLYSTLHEDLNLNEWKYFENCKRIWELGENRQKKRSKGQRGISGVVKMKQKGHRRRESGGTGSGRKNTKPKKKDRGTSPADFSFEKVVAVGVRAPYQFQEDLYMSLEPISSSSFHSSSDCDED